MVGHHDLLFMTQAATEEANSVNAQKRAAKKALKADKKAAHKDGGGVAPAAAAAGAESTPIASVPTKTVVPKTASVPVSTTTIAAASFTGNVPPFHIVINPNVPLTERPVVALTAALLTNTLLDYTLVSDHKSRQTALGLPGDGAAAVVGDFAMARYIVRTCAPSVPQLMGNPHSEQAFIDAWVDYAQSLMKLDLDRRVRAVTMTLEASLQQQQRTYLVGTTMTLADICVFSALGFPAQATDRVKLLSQVPSHATAAYRWISMMASSPAIQEATQLALGVAQNYEAVFDEGCVMDPLVSGMNPLEGAIPGRVVTRFPPEPSGYLHIGHAKAVLLNDYYARRYHGRLIVRFDDTNPSKEKEEYQESIVQDLARLGVKPDVVTYTSDYFEAIHKYALFLIQEGLAYMDNTPQEQMKAERAERIESNHRHQSPEEALYYFTLMCNGSKEGAEWCLRAKIDMKSDNGTMRDPVFYRQNLTPHHRWESKFKAYPTYDMACPIVDSIEGVTHALRTTEYNDRDEQYQWVLKALSLRRVRIHAFARLNFVNTVLSKRKLTWFVENNYVTGWDDARFPTIRGVVRRGINITALRNFVYSQGASRRVVNMEWNKFWAENKKEIDKTAKRFMAIDKEQHAQLTVTNAPEADDFCFISTDYHPKDPTSGKRVVRVAKQVFLESVDVEGIVVNEEIVLLRWGE
jgi:glutamyl-tRNA synthetase